MFDPQKASMPVVQPVLTWHGVIITLTFRCPLSNSSNFHHVWTSQPWSDWSRVEDLGQDLGVYEGRPKVAGSDESQKSSSLTLLEVLLSSPRYGESTE